MPSPSPQVVIAGIGASAGGIEALCRLFDALPPDLGIGYVVIVHLAPHHTSELSQILARHTTMRVLQVHDEQPLPVAADTVFVIAPDRQLELRDGSIRAEQFVQPQGQRSAIDVFFRSLARQHGDGFAMILSGGGSDGVLGARAVKESGGLILVQDPHEALHDSMPRAVIDAEIADVVLPVAGLATRLAELVRDRRRLQPLLGPDGEAGLDSSGEVALGRVFDIVRSRTGHDFSRYKRPTILRRLARRMQLHHCASIDAYLGRLREDPAEIDALFDDLLISVTSFFRDPEAWETLRRLVAAPLVESAQAGQPIRIWVPGCATGEEAYTLAMLVREEFAARGKHGDVVIFGSDVDQAALATAREGVYPAAISADVSESRLARFFRAEGDHYRIVREIRDCVVFAVHSVLRDPPFSKLDLVSCRNLLIYLDRELQQQLQNVFRYSLRDDGFLFIGVSETADPDLFEPVDKQFRIFRARRQAASPPLRLLQVAAAPPVPHFVERARDRSLRYRRDAAELHVETLEDAAPPSVLLGEQWQVVHLSQLAGRFLQVRGGAPTQVITDLVRTDLLDEVRATLHLVAESKQPRLSRFVPVQFNGTSKLVAVLAQPHVARGGEGVVLLTFLEAGDATDADGIGERDPEDELVLALREKLRLAEQRLESMRAEHSVAYEDLRAANEELQSLNEEYRSTTEELETSKEELQSVNEELQTVNNELKLKLEEVSRANSDLENFMAASDLAILFLDRQSCIKRFTEPLRQIFNVKKHDLGRPIGDLTHILEYDGLRDDVEHVLRDLAPVERRVRARDGGEYVVRVRAYRTADHKIDGVVMTFVKWAAPRGGKVET